MDIFLVRHGEAAAGWGEDPDPGLSELGRQQAEEAAVLLGVQACDNTVLVSSPLLRALETAQPLARLLQRSIVEDHAFREIPSPVSLSRRQAWLRQFMQEHWHEQSAELLEWRQDALQRVQQLERPAVIFTHFLVINALVGVALDRPETLCFWPANGSITRLRHTGAGLELLALGEEIETVVN